MNRRTKWRSPFPLDQRITTEVRARVEGDGPLGFAPTPNATEAAEALLAVLEPDVAAALRLGGGGVLLVGDETHSRRTVWRIVLNLADGRNVHLGIAGYHDTVATIAKAAHELGFRGPGGLKLREVFG